MRSALPSLRHGRTLYRLLCLVTAVVLSGIFLSRPAYAVGKVTPVSREPVESDGKWKLNMSIDYGSIPHLPHIPMLFVFTPTMLYERALLDKTGDKPVLNKIPLQNQQPINESLDVGFSDGTGKVFKITKFDVVLRRDHGFEAGEYDLKVKRADDGVQIGQTIKLILKGDNPIIDRRAIVFAGEKKPKGEDKKAEGGDAAADKPAESAETKPLENAEPPPEDPDAPPPVPPKQGGCGCRVGGASGPIEGAGAVLALGLSAGLLARRRGRRAA